MYHGTFFDPAPCPCTSFIFSSFCFSTESSVDVQLCCVYYLCGQLLQRSIGVEDIQSSWADGRVSLVLFFSGKHMCR
jgi:hypothetical protein